MSDSNHLLNQPFGLNIRLPERTMQQVQETASSTVNGLWSPLFNYLDENQNVFMGDVANEISKYNRLTYALGAAAREGKPKVTFDTKG